MYSRKIQSIRSYLENSNKEFVNQEHLKPVYAVLEALEDSLKSLEQNICVPQE